MTNIIDQVTARIEDYRATNKAPCKNYATKAAAERATAKAAATIGATLWERGTPAPYIVFFNEAWGRWVGAIDLSRVLHAHDCLGGFVAHDTGFFTY